MSSSLSEFEIIRQYFEDVGEHDEQVVELGIGDDCAIINPPAGKSLCFSIDTMVEGRHFPYSAPPDRLAVRAMAASLSDLAAMGATPSFFTLSLSIEKADKEWLEGFSLGLKYMADRYQVSLVGGDTTKGPCSVAIQVHGYVDSGMALRRSGARVGDLLVVTGSLGDAGGALDLLGREVETESEKYLLDRYYSPTPRIQEGLLISRYASSCIDISDGLVAEARHISESSSCSITIDIASLPISRQLKNFADKRASVLALTAGDDYELLFTVSESGWKEIQSKATKSMCFTKIGKVEAHGEGVKVLSKGKELMLAKEGFNHFE